MHSYTTKKQGQYLLAQPSYLQPQLPKLLFFLFWHDYPRSLTRLFYLFLPLIGFKIQGPFILCYYTITDPIDIKT